MEFERLVQYSLNFSFLFCYLVIQVQLLLCILVAFHRAIIQSIFSLACTSFVE